MSTTVSITTGDSTTYVLSGTDGSYTVGGDVTYSRTTNFDNLSIPRLGIAAKVSRIMNEVDTVRVDAKVSRSDQRDGGIPYVPIHTLILKLQAETDPDTLHYLVLPEGTLSGLIRSISYTHRSGGQLIDLSIIFEVGTS